MTAAVSVRFRRSSLAATLALTSFLLALILLTAPSSFASTAEDIAALPTLDALNRTESTLSNGGRWAKLNWTTTAGSDSTSGWYSSYGYPTTVGAYWTPPAFSDRYGEAASLKMPIGPGSNVSRYVSLWLDMPDPATAKSGYQLIWAMNSDFASYTVKLSKWSAGAETVLASNPSVVIPAGSTLAISDTGSTVTAWLDTGGGTFASLLSASDTGYSSGYAGVEASGSGSRSLNFKAGSLMGPATVAVPVLDNLERSEAPMATGNWTKTSWTNNFGGAYCCKTGRGYGGVGLTGTSGAYWNVAPASDSKGGVLVSAAVGSGTPALGEYLGLWLDMPSPGSERSGYEARFSGVDGTTTNYKVELARWVGGTRTVLAVKEGFSLATGTTIALTESGGGLVVWSGTTSLAPVISAADTTYSSGYAGLEVGGGSGSLYNLRAGSIAQAPNTTLTSGPSGIVVPHVSLRFTASEENAGFECSLDGAAYSACVSAKTYTPLTDGSHNFRVRSTNQFGVDPTPAERSFQSYAAAPAKVPVLDAFERSEVPLTASQWTKTSWGGSIGGVWWGGYRGYGSSSGLASAYWNANLFKDTAGSVLASAVIGTRSSGTGEYLALLLNLQSPASARSGYEARLTGTGVADTYKLEISKWTSGARTVLATKEGLVLPPDTVIALAETETHLTFWKGTGGSFSSQLSVSDTGATRYASGSAGLEVQGTAGTLYRFRAGNIDLAAPETTILSGPNGTAVPPENVSFTFLSSESGSTFECALDGGAYASCASPKAYPEIGQGPHTVRIRALDKVGNVDATPAERSFQVLSKPVVTTEPATEVKINRATMNATVNPKESATTYQFEYGTTASYGSAVPATAASAGSGGSAIAVSQPLTGLAPDTEYHFRISATNPQGTTKGSDRTFVTTAAPQVVTEPATSLEASKAVLNGSINPKGAATYYHFDYGPTTAYGSLLPVSSKLAGSGRTAVSVNETAEGLIEGRLYHYRLVASNEGGTTYGSDRTFTTPLLPDVTTEQAERVKENEAILSAAIDANGERTTYSFEYGKTSAYGSTAPAAGEEAGEEGEAGNAIDEILHLEPATTYHYRVVAASEAGVVKGGDKTFTTSAATLPPGYEREMEEEELHYTGRLDGDSLGTKFMGMMWSGHFPMMARAPVSRAVRHSGAKTLRINFYPDAATAPDAKNERLRRVVQEAAGRDITLLPYFGMGWPGDNGIEVTWKPYVREMVLAFGPGGTYWNENGSGADRPIKVWEIGNEPNYGTNGPHAKTQYTTQEVEEYGRRFSELAGVARNAAETRGGIVEILLSGLASTAPTNCEKAGVEDCRMAAGDFIRKMGHNDSYDAISLHPYVLAKGANTEKLQASDAKLVKERVYGHIIQARHALEQEKEGSKPIWVTELGWPTDNNKNPGVVPPVSESTQKALIDAAFGMIKARHKELNIDRLFYYNIQDNPNGQAPLDWPHFAGLRRAGGKKKLGWTAFAEQAKGDAWWPGSGGAKKRPASNLSGKAARLNSLINTDGSGALTRFQYWQQSSTPSVVNTPLTENEGEEGDAPLSADVSGLRPSTTYVFHPVFTNEEEETTVGENETFTTPPSTSTSNDVKRKLHGQSGYVWIQGWVKEGFIEGPLPGLGNVHVHIKLFRNGVYQRFVDVMTDSKGEYQSGYIPVGQGDWETQTEFPGGLEWDSSKSDVEPFHIYDGVRIRAQHSGGCWDIFGARQDRGAAVMHGACNEPNNPSTSNQVFTLVPQEGGRYLQIIARNSGRCVDVVDVSTANGSGLQQYDCLGVGQSNQLFEEAWSGDWVAYVAKHSGKCVDVTGANMGWINLQQWSCNGSPQQAYRLEGVEADPIKTETFISAAPVMHGNGQYGNWGLATLSGHVLAGGYSMATRVARIQIQKVINGQWTPTDEFTLNVNPDGSYRFNDYGLAPGIFRVRAVFAGDGEFAKSESAWHQVAIWQANRLIARHSGRCMSLSDAAHQNFNGQHLIQWDCSGSPSFGDGQTFWFWPIGNNVYEITVIGTGKCLDISGSDNGSRLQQWDCTHAANQRFQVLEIDKQPGWYAIRPVHQYRCLDVVGVATNNGAEIDQWDCHWGGNQQWEIQGVIPG